MTLNRSQKPTLLHVNFLLSAGRHSTH